MGKQRKYSALYRYDFYGTYTEDVIFYSEHKAGSAENRLDALRQIRREKEKGIANNASIIHVQLIK